MLAARRISVLLSQSCGELSTIHPYVYCPDSTLIAVLFCLMSDIEASAHFRQAACVLPDERDGLSGSAVTGIYYPRIMKGMEIIMKNTIFKGVATAIVTPMNAQGVDYEAFGRLIEWQIAEGVQAIVAAGTTGEGSTLTDEEHRQVLKFCVDTVVGRVPVIAGTGSNDTAYAIDLTKYACEIGADAMLLVTPYYNKATQKGLIASFTAIADASTKPCILYNVPSRTGCNLLPETVAVLADHPRIVAIKEASGNISQIAQVAALCKDRIDIYSGNDDQIVPVLSLGGVGVISVLSNPLPRETVAICDRFFAGDVAGSCRLQLELLPLINALFCEVNPIPVKAAMAAMGYGENCVRLPLTPIEAEHEQKLLTLMRKNGIQV